MEQVRDITERVRDTRIENKGFDSSEPGVSQVLFGECKTNNTMLAHALRDELDSTNTVYLVSGGVSYPGESTPESLDTAKLNGTIHYWVVVESESPDTNPIVCDVCAESDTAFGEILVQHEHPRDYIEFERDVV